MLEAVGGFFASLRTGGDLDRALRSFSRRKPGENTATGSMPPEFHSG
jgi:hypothetical protein